MTSDKLPGVRDVASAIIDRLTMAAQSYARDQIRDDDYWRRVVAAITHYIVPIADTRAEAKARAVVAEMLREHNMKTTDHAVDFGIYAQAEKALTEANTEIARLRAELDAACAMIDGLGVERDTTDDGDTPRATTLTHRVLMYGDMRTIKGYEEGKRAGSAELERVMGELESHEQERGVLLGVCEAALGPRDNMTLVEDVQELARRCRQWEALREDVIACARFANFYSKAENGYALNARRVLAALSESIATTVLPAAEPTTGEVREQRLHDAGFEPPDERAHTVGDAIGLRREPTTGEVLPKLPAACDNCRGVGVIDGRFCSECDGSGSTAVIPWPTCEQGEPTAAAKDERFAAARERFLEKPAHQELMHKLAAATAEPGLRVGSSGEIARIADAIEAGEHAAEPTTGEGNWLAQQCKQVSAELAQKPACERVPSLREPAIKAGTK